MRVKLGRNKTTYPLTGKWKTKKDNAYVERKIDYKQLDDEFLTLDGFGNRQSIVGTITIQTETPNKYLIKDIITLQDGQEYMISDIKLHYKERESKEISMYLKPRVEYYEITLGSK